MEVIQNIPQKYKIKPKTIEERLNIIEHVLRLYPEKEEDSYIIYYDPDKHTYKVVDEYHNPVVALSEVSFVSRLKAEQHLGDYIERQRISKDS
jgi:hypothetical protein